MEVPMCIPELSYVSPVDLGKTGAEVHAFRVDVTERTVVNINEEFKAAGGGVTYYELTPMQLSAGGTTLFAARRELGLWLAASLDMGPLADLDNALCCSAPLSPRF